MTTFTLPSISPRLSRLALAADTHGVGVLRHIALRVTPNACRFTATDGKLLASIVHEIGDLQCEPIEVVLDRDQFTAVWKLLGKHVARTVTITVERTEVRVTAGMVSAVIRRQEGQYPAFDHVWAKPAGMRWVPCASSLDPDLAATAQQIVGKTRLSFNSPVPPSSSAHCLWATPGPAEAAPVLPLADLQTLVRAPAYWADHEIAILVMPVSRSGEEKQLDLSRFVISPLSAVAAAA